MSLATTIDASFKAQLQKIGEITSDQFRQQIKPTQYLERISYDPTTSKYWNLLSAKVSPNQFSIFKSQRNFDTRLNVNEMKVFKKNGFVVTDRIGTNSFGKAFHDIYSNDLPLFISTDSVLHAWHRSFDKILADIETHYLFETLETILTGMHEALRSPQMTQLAKEDGAVKQILQDTDLFLSVGLSFLVESHQPIFEETRPVFNQIRGKAQTHLGTEILELFGEERDYDFSQFKPRGHYENVPILQQYFKSMTWFGRTEFTLNGHESSARQLQGAVTLYHLAQLSNSLKAWIEFDEVIQAFVGVTDSMTLPQLQKLIEKESLPVNPSSDELTKLLEVILNSGLGIPVINSQVRSSSDPSSPVFMMFGQKFTPDSYAFWKVVYNNIEYQHKTIIRKEPTAVDVAYSVLGNDVAGLFAAEEKTEYHHNLLAVRQAIALVPEDEWKKSITLQWLKTLSELSSATTSKEYPEAMRTRAWADRTMSTQIASWSQLRHDTILYVKESYAMCLCEYPGVYVEPRPEFWGRFREMANSSLSLISRLSFNDPHYLKSNLSYFFQQFAETLEKLEITAVAEVNGQPIPKDIADWLKRAVFQQMGSGEPSYDGWYCRLFYGDSEASCEPEYIVADVHTNPPDNSGPGSILHQAIGPVSAMIISVNCGADKMAYIGPVFSHYEFFNKGMNRMSDSEWTSRVNAKKLPNHPRWTSSYRV
eukprot:TRINITY_DN12313_c0_g1_i1.p1 TRINITY_DN12313_c0_g1~~TRINITY_DN12313_c0_g1_i1.p1  ORF type:complete len:713 (-),score=96.26 TRINITY_DN12313_c0_g1_i1:59-2176(-)